jgi:hypothetical protein
MNLTVIRIAMRIGISCALIAVGAVDLFIVIRHKTHGLYWMALLPAIFTLDVGGRPTLAFEAKNLRESQQLCHEHWLRRDIADLMSNSAPLWDGKAWRLDARPRMKLPCTGKQCGMPRRRREICC